MTGIFPKDGAILNHLRGRRDAGAISDSRALQREFPTGPQSLMAAAAMQVL